MYKIKETIIVEGNYDKIKLSGFIDGIIFVTNGFAVFNNKKAQQSIRTLAERTGIVILTDSDAAGFKIRNFVKQLVQTGDVKHAYIPEMPGKERRKRIAGKEGLLGVEGIDEKIILDSLKKCGCTIEGEKQTEREHKPITKTDMFMLGLSGGADSSARRTRLAASLGLPSKISANMLLEVLNKLMSLEELHQMVANTDEMC